MNFTVESWVALAIGAPLVYGFICRAKMLSFGKTKVLPTLFHMVGGLQSLAVVVLALLRGSVTVPEWLGLGMCGLWLLWSYYSWSGPSAPEHALTRPAPLDVMEGRR